MLRPKQLSAEFRGKRILELGSGAGLLGLCVAAVGGHVLLTDLPSVVDESLRPNILRNKSQSASGNVDVDAPTWPESVAVGKRGGSAACAALDWNASVSVQCAPQLVDFLSVDVILAAETVWLKELVAPFVSTVLQLLKGPKNPTCLMSFCARAKTQSEVFVQVEDLIESFRSAGCSVSVIHSAPSPKEPSKTVFVYRITFESPTC